MIVERRGDWICTASGHKFWPLDPRPDEVRIDDIAHALSHLCRFGGHSREFYSVAQHSVHVSHLCPPEDALWGLLHDAPEAYLMDLPRPIKQGADFLHYRLAEAVLMTRILDRFGIKQGFPDSVRTADETMLATEARDLMEMPDHQWTTGEPAQFKIRPWSHTVAKHSFLARFKQLYQP